MDHQVTTFANRLLMLFNLFLNYTFSPPLYKIFKFPSVLTPIFNSYTFIFNNKILLSV